jgi:hypothetical protein
MGLVHRDANPALFARLLSMDATYYVSSAPERAHQLMQEALVLVRQGVDRHTKQTVYQKAIYLFVGKDREYPFYDVLDEMEMLLTDEEDGVYLAHVYCIRGYLAAKAGQHARALKYVDSTWGVVKPHLGAIENPGLLEIPGLLAKLALVSVLAGDAVRGRAMLDRLDGYSGPTWELVAAGDNATRARGLLAALEAEGSTEAGRNQ